MGANRLPRTAWPKATDAFCDARGEVVNGVGEPIDICQLVAGEICH
jgi:hypothetical protein